MKILKKEELEVLSTRRLLSLYRRVRKEFHLMYYDIAGYDSTTPENDPMVMRCVNLDKYRNEIKSILDNREHVERTHK
jgi:hypothetical protein